MRFVYWPQSLQSKLHRYLIIKSEVEHAPYTYPQADAEIDSRGHQ